MTSQKGRFRTCHEVAVSKIEQNIDMFMHELGARHPKPVKKY